MNWFNNPTKGGIKMNETLKDYYRRLPTISEAQCCDLKVDEPGRRVWVCRYNNTISIEVFTGLKWETVEDHV
jgi:hypothetical protein